MIFTRHFVCHAASACALIILATACCSAQPAVQASIRELSLEDAIQRALGVGEEISVAQAGVRRAEANVTVAGSQFLPQVAASLVYTRTLQSQYSSLSSSSGSSQPADTSSSSQANSASSLFKNLPFGKENQWSLGLTASQNIFTGGRITAQREAAEARERSANIDLTAAQAQLVLNVTQSYYDAVLADRLVRISEDALEQSEEVYKNAELAFKVGEKAEFEALRAKVARDNQIPQLIQQRNTRQLAYYRLKQLLNVSLDDSVMLTTGVSDSLERFAPVGDTSVEHRSSVVQATENVTASEASVRVAESQRWPQVSVSTRYAPVAYPEGFFPSFSDWHTDWTVSLNVSVPIYTGGAISGNIASAEASRDEADARARQAREVAALDVRQSQNELRAAEANLRSTASTASEAERAYQIARVRYQQGISTQVELDDTRLQEEQARVNYARAVRNFQVARAKLSLIRDLPVNPAQAQISGAQSQTAITQQAATFNSPSAAGASQFPGGAQTGAPSGPPSTGGVTAP